LTYVVPNFFIENNNNNLIKIDNLFCLNYITKQKSDFISVRTTMHCMIILLDGSKVIHLKDTDINVNSNEICFLTQNNYFMSERITKDLNYKSLIIYFDDKFIFEGTKAAILTQIGNAVPPGLSKAIGKEIKKTLDKIYFK